MPAVAALHSGSALAASSSLQCIQNQAPVFPPATSAPDLYFRVQLHQLLQGQGSGPPHSWYLSGDIVEAARFGDNRITNRLLARGLWKQVTLDKGLATLASQTLHTAPSLGHSSRLVLGPRWVALRVTPVRGNRGGWGIEIVGVVDGTSTGTAVTGSCWTSFAV